MFKDPILESNGARRLRSRTVIVYLDSDKENEKKLPLNQPVEVIAKFPRSSELGYTCAMWHHAGVIKIQ